MIVLDASVLIAHLESTDAHNERATQLLVDAAGEAFAASPLTLAEVLVGPARVGRVNAARSALRELAVATVPLAEDASTRLAIIRATTRLRLPDCCVLLAAETAQASIATFDDRLATSAADLGLEVRN